MPDPKIETMNDWISAAPDIDSGVDVELLHAIAQSYLYPFIERVENTSTEEQFVIKLDGRADMGFASGNTLLCHGYPVVGIHQFDDDEELPGITVRRTEPTMDATLNDESSEVNTIVANARFLEIINKIVK